MLSIDFTAVTIIVTIITIVTTIITTTTTIAVTITIRIRYTVGVLIIYITLTPINYTVLQVKYITTTQHLEEKQKKMNKKNKKNEI